MNGEIEVGTVANPVQSGVLAKIIIADDGPGYINWDPIEISRGLISHGRITMHGEIKTPNADLASPALRRSKELVLTEFGDLDVIDAGGIPVAQML